MNWEIFYLVFLVFLAFIIAQGVLSWFDGFFSQAQLQARGIKGWSFLQHTGMYLDVALSALVAYLASKYQFSYLSPSGISTLAGCTIAVLCMLDICLDISVTEPDHCAHDGTTRVAGCIHATFAVLVMWVFVQVYLDLTTSTVSHFDVMTVSTALAVLLFFSVVRLSPHWSFSDFAKKQVTVSEVGLLLVTGFRLWLA